MRYAIGIDIGGTITKIGLVSEDGKCIKKTSFRTKEFNNFSGYVNELNKSIYKISPKDYDISGIGIGAPNASKNGTIETPANLKWTGKLNLIQKLKEDNKLPIFLSNDANCAAVGEMMYGNAKLLNDFIVITLGTGLGSGIVSNGMLVEGADGFAAELGHYSINNMGRLTGLGVQGGLEAYVSATGIKRTIMYMLSRYMDESIFRDISFNNLHGEDITKAAEKNDSIAIKTFEYTGKILGEALSNFVSFSQPQAIILTGGLVHSGKWIIEPTKKSFEKNLLPFYKGKVKLLTSGLEDKDSAILGSAALVWKNI
ncbi:MAG: glucokinase [Cytophagia bacterium]|jgi:glucokinase|nr:glucokinase [Cytophagia bacterium]|tara:strand:+ start:978 stop:1916 length:939 start_codon:yes stop_codon:yes gene_type:complete